MSHYVDQALKRPADYHKLTPRHQWAIDSRLGILDWDPTDEEREEYTRKIKERRTRSEDE